MTKLTLDGELRQEAQHDASGQLFRWELRDVAAARVFYGTDLPDLLATQIDGYNTTSRPSVADIGSQYAARREYSINLATAIQNAANARYEDERGRGAVDLLPEAISRAVRADKARPPRIRSWRPELPQLVVVESSVLRSPRPAVPRGNVIIVRDLDELSLLESIAETHRWRLVDRAADEAEEPW